MKTKVKLFAFVMILGLILWIAAIASADDYNYYLAVDAFLNNPEFANGTHWSNADDGNDVQHPKTYEVSSSGCNAYVRDFAHECWQSHKTDPYWNGGYFDQASEITDGDIIFIDGWQNGEEYPHWYAVIQRLDNDTLKTAEASGNEVRVCVGKYTVSKPGNSLQSFQRGYHMPGYVKYTGQPQATSITKVEVDNAYANVYWNNVWPNDYTVRVEYANGGVMWQGSAGNDLYRRLYLGAGNYKVSVIANFPNNESRQSNYVSFTCYESDTPEVHAQVDGPYVDITWSNQRPSVNRKYGVAVVEVETNTLVAGTESYITSTSSRFHVAPGNYRAFVTAVYPDETENRVSYVDFTCYEPDAPVVHAEADGNFIDVTWSNQRPGHIRKYGVTVVEVETNKLVAGTETFISSTSASFCVGPGNYRVFVTAVYPDEAENRVTYADVTCAASETPLVFSEVDGPYVDISWINQRPGNNPVFGVAVVEVETNTLVAGTESYITSTSSRFHVAPGNYRAFVTAIFPDESAYLVGTTDFTCVEPDAPVVHAEADGPFIDVTWSNQRPGHIRKYGVTVVEVETNTLVAGTENFVSSTSARFFAGSGNYRIFVTAVYPDEAENRVTYADVTCSVTDTSLAFSQVDGPYVDIYWINQNPSGNPRFGVAVVKVETNTLVAGTEDYISSTSARFHVAPGNYRAFVTAILPDGSAYLVGTTDFTCVEPDAPVVHAETDGPYVDVTWSNQQSGYIRQYGVTVVDVETNTLVAGTENFVTSTSIRFYVGLGDFRVFVTAVYPDEAENRVSFTDFTCTQWETSVNGGDSSIHITGETIQLSAAISTYDTCRLAIYQCPVVDGEVQYDQSVLYWSGALTSPEYSISFTEPGFYYCYFIGAKGINTFKSKLIGWYVYAIGEGGTPDLFLPHSLTAIEAEAFSGIAAKGVVIPESVISITGNPFSESAVNTIYGFPDSPAQTLADSEGYYFVPINSAWLERH